MLFYVKTSNGEFLKTIIDPKCEIIFNRDIKVFKLSDGTTIKTNRFTFLESLKSLPESAISGEVIWNYQEKDVTEFLVY
jgi:hypothetical protein